MSLNFNKCDKLKGTTWINETFLYAYENATFITSRAATIHQYINELIKLLDFSVPWMTGGVTEKRKPLKHGVFCCWMKMQKVLQELGTSDADRLRPRLLFWRMDGRRSVAVLARLKILVVKLLLSLIELSQLLGLPFAQLLPLHIMSGETLRATTNLIGFCLNLLQTRNKNNELLPFHQIWNTCRFLCRTFHLEGPSSSPV